MSAALCPAKPPGLIGATREKAINLPISPARGRSVALAPSDRPDARRAKGTVLAGVEPDEISLRDPRPTAPAGELAFLRDYLALEAYEPASLGSDHARFALDDSLNFGSLQDFARDRRISSNSLDPIDRRRDRQFRALELPKQLDAERDRIGVRFDVGSVASTATAAGYIGAARALPVHERSSRPDD